MFKAPKKIVREIERIQRLFLWGGNEDQKKMAWVKWSDICKPKEKGGLGVKNLTIFNLALLTKWRWRLLNGNGSALWMRVLEARYGRERPWFGNSMSVREARKSSIWWRDLALIGDDSQLGTQWFKEVAKKRIGNGTSVKFWTDIWFGTEPLSTVFPTVMESHNDKNVTVAKMGSWTASGWRWSWNNPGAANFSAAVLNSNNDNFFAAFVDFMQGAQLSSNEDDRWVWTIDLPRGFTVNSCYNWMNNRVMQDNPQADVSVTKVCKSMWKCDAPSKVLVFCWRLLLHKLPTRDKLLSRGIVTSMQAAECVFCHRVMESCDHIFCRCELVRAVCCGIFRWLNVQGVIHNDVITMYEGVVDLVRHKKVKRIKGIFWAATVYQIWFARNSIIFNNKVVSVGSIINSIKFVSWGWFIARKGRFSGLSFSDWFHSPMGCISSL